MARSITASFAVLGLVALGLTACDAKENPYEVKKKASVDIHSYEKEMTPEELAEARKAAGHPSTDQIAEENAKMFEKGAREYVKTRLPEYRDIVTELRAYLDQIEKGAPKWKDDAAFEKFNTKYKADVDAFLDVYDELTAKGVEGGNTQADLGWAVRAWEALNNDLGPGVIDNAQLPVAIKEIRDRLDKVSAALDDIEKDETLEVNPLYKAPKKDKRKKKK
ncbi:hypothetical protein ENSA5_43580 [Enhygromyxa salina]|uniref:Lipoprotein n=1 Tax=Enhygromyxa salina TaxID=215803 RepID=A0A2S9XK81_9BACT|nr:hypothetical protein [Enhygromyxa salina]PRP93263.1 hypothetical protein ENSA5_43580 [Enhygromyxa salina]